MIGRYSDGQSLASITYAFPEGYRHGEGREDTKRLYVLLHRFDSDGHHIDSDIWRAGTWREQQQHPPPSACANGMVACSSIRLALASENVSALR